MSESVRAVEEGKTGVETWFAGKKNLTEGQRIHRINRALGCL